MLAAAPMLVLVLLAADTGDVSAPTIPFPPVRQAVETLVPPSLDSTAAPAWVVAVDTSRAVEYSDAYFTRLTIHKYASYAMIPMFVAQYAAGEQLLDKGSDAPRWARDLHGPLAAGVAGLFTVNTVTGGWNLWEGRHDPEGRTRRTLHGALMLLADAGFAATGMLAEGAEENSDRRNLHRTVALSSMGVSLVSYAIMLPLFGNH